MATITLIEQLDSLKMTEFEFSAFEKKITMDQKSSKKMPYFLLTLVEPIKKVTGSQKLSSGDRQRSVQLFAENVRVVQVWYDLIKKYHEEFDFETDADGKLTGAGKYAGDMLLDVAKGSRNVWLTDTPLSKQASEYYQTRNDEDVDDLLKRQQALNDKE